MNKILESVEKARKELLEAHNEAVVNRDYTLARYISNAMFPLETVLHIEEIRKK